jgi:hypothetical protein
VPSFCLRGAEKPLNPGRSRHHGLRTVAIGSILCAATSAMSEARHGSFPFAGAYQISAGADVAPAVWLIYSSTTLAPLADTIHADGLRLRFSGGYGAYRYSAVRPLATPCGVPPFDPCAETERRFEATTSFAEGLVGYQWKTGDLTTKLFGGVVTIDHNFAEPDPFNVVTGRETGPKAVAEFWLDIGQSAWTSMDLSYTTAHETGAARWRAGWRAMPGLSIGPEVRYDRNADDDAARAGMFATVGWTGGELSAAAGFGGTVNGREMDARTPYATVQLMFDF